MAGKASTGFFPVLLQQISYKFWFVLKNSLKDSPSALPSDTLNAKGEKKDLKNIMERPYYHCYNH